MGTIMNMTTRRNGMTVAQMRSRAARNRRSIGGAGGG